MKRFVGVVFALLILGLVSVAYAQDSEDSAPVAGFFAVPSTSGTLEEEDDDIYLLTLEDVPEVLVWVLNSPSYAMGDDETSLVVSQWTADTETPLTATALLRLEDLTLKMTAGEPTYDPMSGTFTLQVTNVEKVPAEEGKKKTKFPDEFEAATLMLVLDEPFNTGLFAGGDILVSEGRYSNNEGGSEDTERKPRS